MTKKTTKMPLDPLDPFGLKPVIKTRKAKTTTISKSKKMDKNTSADKDKYKIVCGISGDVIPANEAKHVYVKKQRTGTSAYVSEKYLHKLNTCNSCKRLFQEELEDSFCLNCIAGAVNTYVKGYNNKAENSIPQLVSPLDPTKIKFNDKNVSEFYAGRNPASFIYSCGDCSLNLFGVELEYESKTSHGLAVLNTVNYIKDFAILKRDSTLRDGFEIVSAPADKFTHYTLWDKLFEHIEHDENIQCTPYSYDPERGKGVGCGLHIHISKNSMIHHNSYSVKKQDREQYLEIVTGLPIAKLQTFVYHKSNRPFMENMAGRKSNMYNNFTQKRGIVIKDGRVVSGAKSVIELGTGGIRAAMDHRTAVNFNSSNGQTIEFRIFRSTKNKQELMKGIDFVDAICCFCRTGNASLLEMENWIYFYEFVCKNRQDYPFLYKHFETDPGFLQLLANKEKGIEEKIIDEEEIVDNNVVGNLNQRIEAAPPAPQPFINMKLRGQATEAIPLKIIPLKIREEKISNDITKNPIKQNKNYVTMEDEDHCVFPEDHNSVTF